MASRTPQRTDIELPSGSMATIRKAMARDMRRAEDANVRRQQDIVAQMDADQIGKLRSLRGDGPGMGGDERDPDRMLLERHDSEALVNACTIEIEAVALTDEDVPDSWMDILDADDHEALFEGIMWYSRIRPSTKKG